MFVFAVLFAWAALMTASGSNPLGGFGTFAYQMAHFPELAQVALQELRGKITGDEADKYLRVPRTDADLERFEPVATAAGLSLPGLVLSGDREKAERGWRVIGGTFMLDDGPQSAIVMLDPDFRVQRILRLNDAAERVKNAAGRSRRILHGMQVLGDGSVVFGFDHGTSLQRLDACGGLIWQREGNYHHAVTLSEGGDSVWALRSGGFPLAAGRRPEATDVGFVELDIATGNIRRALPISAVMTANPDLGLFDISRFEDNDVTGNSTEVLGTWNGDPFHFNDVEALPRSMAGAFPGFAAGDLLVSSRTLNTLMVIDPRTLKVKWHRIGATMRQHDPDWQPDGLISVFDNRMGRGASQIVSLDPSSQKRKVTVDGAGIGFYSRIRGNHQKLSDGSVAIVSTQQGRAMEIGADGEVILEYYNLKPGSNDTNFVLTELQILPEDALDLGTASCTGG
ncbi:hypothetical protein JT55_15605 [Rhodovulum sp. NI22]|nr:hypothetical protein JT55_15605 [Rhodovulum sp. NI22]